MRDSDSFESKVLAFPKEFRKDLWQIVDRRFHTVLASSLILHILVVAYFLANPLPKEHTMRTIARVQERLARAIKENEIRMNERLAQFDLSKSKPLAAEEKPEAPKPKATQPKPRAKTSAPSKKQAPPKAGKGDRLAGRRGGRKVRDTAAIESAVGSKGILGLLTSTGSTASGREVEDILAHSNAEQKDLDETLSNLSGMATAAGSGNGLGTGTGSVKGGRSQGVEDIDGLVSGLGKTKTSTFSRTGELVVVNETPLIEGTSKKGVVGRNQDDVQAVVMGHNNSIQYCYERELKRNPSLRGKVVVRFTITPQGTVKDVEIVSSTLDNRRVEQCIVSRIRRWNDFGAIDPKFGDTTIRQVYAFGY